MSTSQLYSMLALERCRVYLAQLCAANHLSDSDPQDIDVERDTVTRLLEGMGQDLEIIEHSLSSSDR